MFEKIFFPVDLSETSSSVIRAIKEMKKFGTEEVHLFHAIEYDPVALIEGGVDVDEFVAKLKRKAEEKMTQHVKELSKYFKVSYSILPTIDAAKAIVENSEGYTAMLIPSRSKTTLSLGKTTEKVIKASEIPTLVIRTRQGLRENHYEAMFAELFSKIAFLHDLSDGVSGKIQETANMLAKFGVREICIIHVVELDVALETKLSREEIMNPLLPIPKIAEILSEYWMKARSKLEKIEKSLNSSGFTTSVVVRFGSSERSIERIVKEEKISLVVVWRKNFDEVSRAEVPVFVLK